MGAVAGAFDQFAAGEQRFDLGGGEGVAGFDGRLAGHHVQHLVKQFLIVQVKQFLFTPFEQFLDEPERFEAVQEGGEGVEGEGVEAEGGQFDPQADQ